MARNKSYQLSIMKNKYGTYPLILAFCIVNGILFGYFVSHFHTGYAYKPYLERRKVHKILFWTNSFHGVSWGMGTGTKKFEKCEYQNCETTSNKADYDTSDSIMFQNRFMDVPFPKYRFPFQKWWLQCHESPVNEPNYRQFNGKFNATTNYAWNSDIPLLFGPRYFQRYQSLNDTHKKDYAKGREKPVAWFNSNCDDYSNRMQYVKHLQKYIAVDIYGACGPLKCHKAGSNSICDSLLGRDYKFYLAFENSICVDYVTEKIWRAINNNVVPIVLGGADYSRVLPPNSYIDIKDYKSPKELAEYLNMLHKNDAKYNALFDWKLKWKFEWGLKYHCAICEYMNKYGHITKVYDRIDIYWGRSNCTTAEKFYKNIDKSSWT